MRRLSADEAVEALAWLSPLNGTTGFDAAGWQDVVWILHAMYESDHLPDAVTYDQVRRHQVARGLVEPIIIGSVNLDDPSFGAHATGVRLGASSNPGPGWRRLSWRDLGSRLGVDPFGVEFPLGYGSFPVRSWPVSIRPPAEGALDKEQWEALVAALAMASETSWETPCLSYASPLMGGDFDNPVLRGGTLQEFRNVYDQTWGAPSNLWPHDRAWFVYTDADLWATKVSGPTPLIHRIEADENIETVRLT